MRFKLHSVKKKKSVKFQIIQQFLPNSNKSILFESTFLFPQNFPLGLYLNDTVFFFYKSLHSIIQVKCFDVTHKQHEKKLY